MPNYFISLEPGCFYHVFNRGNNGDPLFYQPRNYDYFLQQLQHHLSGCMLLYAYCLMPNHFHLLVQVKEAAELQKLPLQKSLFTAPELVSEQFRKFFLGYATAVKKQEQRTGSLFEKNFKRLKVSDAGYRRYVVNYIHQNPRKHGFTSDYQSYPYSSYRLCLVGRDTWLRGGEVLSWFGGRAGFEKYHEDNEVMGASS